MMQQVSINLVNKFLGQSIKNVQSKESAKQVSFELNHKEYGLTQEGTTPKTIDFHFNPSEYGILNDYSVVKEIYRVMLSPTIITLTTHKETNMVRSYIDLSDSCLS